MYKTGHFVTGTFKSHARFVTDAEYSLILDNVVKATCDIFIVRQSAGGPQFLMGERQGLPWPSWWIPGGRMTPGETVAQTAARVLKRELALDIAAAFVPGAGSDADALERERAQFMEQRVATVAHYTFLWDTRTQEPIQNGTSDVSIILRVDVSDAEAASIALLAKEYKRLEWRAVHEQARPPAVDALHPALAQGLRELVAMMEWQQLKPLLADAAATAAAGEEGDAARNQAIVTRLLAFARARGEI